MIGEEVRRRREGLGLTGAQLAARAGMAPSAVSQIETGKRTPSSASVVKLAEALGVAVGDLYPKGQTQLPLGDGKLMDRPDIAEWLRRQGYINTEEFLSRVPDLGLEVDEEEFPHAVEDAIEELHRERDHLLELLNTAGARRTLFPQAEIEGLAGNERLRAVFKPTRQARELRTEVRREYLSREVALVNYSKELFLSDEALGYLAYGSPTDEYTHARHQRMVEARVDEARRALEESYAKAAAV